MDEVGKSKSKLWITWETQRRNAELAASFQAQYVALDYSDLPRSIRYCCCVFFTLRQFFFYPYELIFIQCPSLILALLLSVLRQVRSFTLVIDAHNAVFEYLRSKNALLRLSMRYCLKNADFILVSNSSLADIIGVYKNAPLPLVLPDKLPLIRKAFCPQRLEDQEHPIITFICSFAPDEPAEIFLQAMEMLAMPYTLFVTGKKRNAGTLLRFASNKIHFTDYLLPLEYDALLQHSDLLVDLTTRNDCLVCGAYEALAIGVPILLSNSKVLRGTFSKGCIFADNTVEDYQLAIKYFLANEKNFRKEILDFQQEYIDIWNSLFEQAAQKLSLWGGR